MEQKVAVHICIEVTFFIQKYLNIGAEYKRCIKSVEGKNGLVELTVLPHDKQGCSQDDQESGYDTFDSAQVKVFVSKSVLLGLLDDDLGDEVA